MRARGHAVVAEVAASVFLALRVLAFADAPDPSWIGGLWDDDAYDDFVILVTSASGVVESNPCVHPGPILIAPTPVACSDEGPGPTRALTQHRPRDPPAA